MAKNQRGFEKRRRDMGKKQKAEEKRERRRKKKEQVDDNKSLQHVSVTMFAMARSASYTQIKFSIPTAHDQVAFRNRPAIMKAVRSSKEASLRPYCSRPLPILFAAPTFLGQNVDPFRIDPES